MDYDRYPDSNLDLDFFDEDSNSIIIGLLAAALSGAIVGMIAGSLGAVAFMLWRAS